MAFDAALRAARLLLALERGTGGAAGIRVLERIVGMAEHDAELEPGEPDSDDLDLDVVEDVLGEHRWAYDGSLPR